MANIKQEYIPFAILLGWIVILGIAGIIYALVN
jgi:hypothetical protein